MISSYDQLSRSSRISLLGHYLSKMVTLMHAAELEEKELKARRSAEGKNEIVSENTMPAALSQDSNTIVAYLKKVGSASAREINRYGGIPRSSMFRKLHELTQAGVIGKTGVGKHVRYRLMDSGK